MQNSFGAPDLDLHYVEVDVGPKYHMRPRNYDWSAGADYSDQALYWFGVASASA